MLTEEPALHYDCRLLNHHLLDLSILHMQDVHALLQLVKFLAVGSVHFVYVSEVLGIPNHLKRANAHAERRELSTSVLDYDSVNLPIFRIQESKVDVHLMSFLYYLSP